MRRETRAEFSLSLIFCQLLPSIKAYFSLWGYKPKVDFTNQQCCSLALCRHECQRGSASPAPSPLPSTPRCCSARGHPAIAALSWGCLSSIQCHLTPFGQLNRRRRPANAFSKALMAGYVLGCSLHSVLAPVCLSEKDFFTLACVSRL